MGSALFNFIIQMVILVVATLIAGKPPLGLRLGFAVLALAVVLVFATGFAFLLSAINVYLRDVQYLVEIVLMFGFWAVPVVYRFHQVGDSVGHFWENVYLANPMAVAVLGFQRAFWVAGDSQPQAPHIGRDLVVALVVGVVFLWFSQRVFARLQSNFAQEL